MKNSKIEWTDHTFNPWIGCTKVSPGCAHCYAESLDKRWGHDSWGPGKPRRRTSESYWKQPLAWNKEAGITNPFDAKNHRPRVFCASLADWLDEEVPVEWLADLLDIIRRTPCLDWLLLTKRPQNWRQRMEAAAMTGARFADIWLGGRGPDNVWIGTTVEDQARADERIPHLLRIPARVRFLSCEPLLSKVVLPWHGDYSENTRTIAKIPGIHWVICGGESGPNARPMHPDWARSLRDQCASAHVPFFFKQWGAWAPGECVTADRDRLKCATFDGNYWDYSTQTRKQSENCHRDDSPDVYHVGKHAAGSLLDGKEHNGFPSL